MTKNFTTLLDQMTKGTPPVAEVERVLASEEQRLDELLARRRQLMPNLDREADRERRMAIKGSVTGITAEIADQRRSARASNSRSSARARTRRSSAVEGHRYDR